MAGIALILAFGVSEEVRFIYGVAVEVIQYGIQFVDVHDYLPGALIFVFVKVLRVVVEDDVPVFVGADVVVRQV